MIYIGLVRFFGFQALPTRRAVQHCTIRHVSGKIVSLRR